MSGVVSEKINEGMSDRTGQNEIAPYLGVYRPRGFWWAAFLVIGIAFFCGGIAGTWFSLAVHDERLSLHLLQIGLCACVLFMGAYCLLYALKWRMVLFPDRLSIEDVVRTKEIFHHQIRGWRIQPTNPTCLVLQPSGERARKVKIALTFPIDDQLEQWLETLPCLDVEERAASLDEITGDEGLGQTLEDRSAAWVHGMGLSKKWNIASIAICCWGLFYPKPYILAMVALIALPWAGVEIVRRSKGLFRIDQRPNDAHPNVAYLIILPALVLMLRSLLDFNTFQSARSFLFYVAVGGGLAFFAAVFDKTLWARKLVFVMFCLFTFVYGFGAVIEANALLDHSAGSSFSAIVRGKHIVEGKHTSYNLALSPWGPKTKPGDLEVSRATYDSIRCGDIAYITLRRGALGIPWHYLQTWQRTESSIPCK